MELKQKVELIEKLASVADKHELTDEQVIATLTKEEQEAIGVGHVMDIPHAYENLHWTLAKQEGNHYFDCQVRFMYHFRYGTAMNPKAITITKDRIEERKEILKDLKSTSIVELTPFKTVYDTKAFGISRGILQEPVLSQGMNMPEYLYYQVGKLASVSESYRSKAIAKAIARTTQAYYNLEGLDFEAVFEKKMKLVRLERALYIKGAIVVNRRYQAAKRRKTKQHKK